MFLKKHCDGFCELKSSPETYDGLNLLIAFTDGKFPIYFDITAACETEFLSMLTPESWLRKILAHSGSQKAICTGV